MERRIAAMAVPKITFHPNGLIMRSTFICSLPFAVTNLEDIAGGNLSTLFFQIRVEV